MVHVFPQDPSLGDSHDKFDAATLASLVYGETETDYVVDGLDFNVDYTNNNFDLTKGKAKISAPSGTAHQTGEEREHGLGFVIEIETGDFTEVPLSDSAVNYVYLDVGIDQDDTASIEVDTSDPPGSLGTEPTLKLGEIDTANNNKTLQNRYPPGQNIYCQLNTSDTSVDLNNTSWTEVNWDTEEHIDGAFSHSGSDVTIDEDGHFRVSVNIYHNSDGSTRQNPILRLTKNGSAVGVTSGSGYMRDSESHNHSSNSFTKVVEVTAGDTLAVEAMAEADTSGSVNPVAGENVFLIERMNR